MTAADPRDGLPEPAYFLYHDDATGTEISPSTPLYSADQMRAYGEQCIEHACPEAVDSLVMKWRSQGAQCEGSDEITIAVGATLEHCADDLEQATREPRVVVDDAMVGRYVEAVNAYLGSLTPKDWEIERFNPAESIAKVARIGLTAALTPERAP